MAHMIETSSTGEAAAVFARQDAWHKLGTTLPDAFTAEQAMELGHLGGWDVRKTPITTTVITDDGVTTLEVPDKFATVRTNPFTGQPDYLDVVGTDWQPIQNEEHAAFLNALVDESGAIFDTAGSLRGGRDVFITMRLPETMMIGGVDRVDLNLAALNSHTGKRAFRVMATPIRVVCANTEQAAIDNNLGVFSVRHTKNASAAVAQARQALDLTWAYMEAFEAEAERMIQTSLSEAEFLRIVEAEFGAGDDPSKAGATRASKRIETMQQLFMDAETNGNIRLTRWAGYQAITEYADHYSLVKGEEAARELRRAERALTGGLVPVKQQAFNAFRVPVAV